MLTVMVEVYIVKSGSRDFNLKFLVDIGFGM